MRTAITAASRGASVGPGDSVRVRTQREPALRSEDLFVQLFELGARGKVNRIGAPGPITTAELVREFRDEFFYLAYVRVSLQRLLAGTRP